MNNYRIVDIATSINGNMVAVAFSNQMIRIWDIMDKRYVCEYESKYETGGKRISIISTSNGTYCVTGAYNRYGISLHSAIDGTNIWNRQDLTKIQRLSFSPLYDNNIIACFDNRSCNVLRLDSGRTVAKLHGVRNFYESPYGPYLFFMKAKKYELFHRDHEIVIGKIKPNTFAILDAIFTHNTLILSEAGGRVICYNIEDVKIAWLYQPEKGSHVFKLGYCEDNNEIILIEWSYEKGGSPILIVLDIEKGNIIRRMHLENYYPEGNFASNGMLYINAAGYILNTNSFNLYGRL